VRHLRRVAGPREEGTAQVVVEIRLEAAIQNEVKRLGDDNKPGDNQWGVVTFG
jgi:hypothetical protein